MLSNVLQRPKVFAMAAATMMCRVTSSLAVSFALAVLAVAVLHVDTASAWTKKLTASRSQVASACGAIGETCAGCQGTGEYSCDNTNNGCYVQCDAKGNCTGGCPDKKPARIVSSNRVLGVLTAGQLAQPDAPSSRPPKRGPITGDNILDGGSGFGSQGPAAAGSPLNPGRGTAPPPGRVN